MREQGILEPTICVYRRDPNQHRDGAGCEAGVRETMTAPFVLDGHDERADISCLCEAMPCCNAQLSEMRSLSCERVELAFQADLPGR